MVMRQHDRNSMVDEAKFSVGTVVTHRLFGYRGVIYDVDAVFQGSEEWYQQMALTRPPRDAPWYRVLVHKADHETYVAERNLADDVNGDVIEHPRVDELFEAFVGGRYRARVSRN